jgi:hypothetical protein
MFPDGSRRWSSNRQNLAVAASFLWRTRLTVHCRPAKAFSSEVDTGSREENASKQESRASVLIQSEPKML